jgi:hypothetical protein
LPLADRLAGWGTLTWSRVADAFPQGDVRRSWDQPLSLTTGIAWKGSSASISALAGWHRGWPRTRLDLAPPSSGSAHSLGARNDERWGDYYTLDLRSSWTWIFASGDLSMVLDVTNASNRHNECCTVLEMDDESPALEAEVDHWLPAIVNIGFTYRWRSR